MTKPIDPAAFEAGEPASAADDSPDAIPFTAVPLRRRPTGWTAYRQRVFIEALAETGSVTAAAEEAGASARSAYRLRARPDGASFALAWDQAQTQAARHLLDVAVERATIGRLHGIWKDGRRIGEERIPSDRLLVFLLGHLQPTRFGKLSGILPFRIRDTVEKATRCCRRSSVSSPTCPCRTRPTPTRASPRSGTSPMRERLARAPAHVARAR